MTETNAAATTETTTTTETTAPESGVVESGSQSSQTDSSDADFYAAAKAAAGKALRAEREARQDADIAKDEGQPATSGLAADTEKAPAAAAAPADDEPKLAKLLRAREQGQKERQEAESHAARVRQQAEAAAQDMLARARAQAEALLREAEVGGRKKLDELMSPEAMLARQADEQDPVYKLGKRFEAELAKRDQALEEMRGKLSQSEQWRQQREALEAQHARTTAEKAFIMSASAEKYPFARTLWDDGELLEKAHKVVGEVREAAKQSGEQFACTDDDIMQYLEKQAKSRLSANGRSLPALLQQVEGGKGAALPGQRATGPRTLSTQHASERRASPKPLSEMNDEEARNAMVAAARKRLRSAE